MVFNQFNQYTDNKDTGTPSTCVPSYSESCNPLVPSHNRSTERLDGPFPQRHEFQSDDIPIAKSYAVEKLKAMKAIGSKTTPQDLHPSTIQEKERGYNHNELIRRHLSAPGTRIDGGVYPGRMGLERMPQLLQPHSPLVLPDELIVMEEDELVPGRGATRRLMANSEHNVPIHEAHQEGKLKMMGDAKYRTVSLDDQQIPLDPKVVPSTVTTRESVSDAYKHLLSGHKGGNEFPPIIILPGGKRARPQDIHIELGEDMSSLLAGAKGAKSYQRLEKLLKDIKQSPLIPGKEGSVLKTCWAIPISQLLERVILINEKYSDLYTYADKMQSKLVKSNEALLEMTRENQELKRRSNMSTMQ